VISGDCQVSNFYFTPLTFLLNFLSANVDAIGKDFFFCLSLFVLSEPNFVNALSDGKALVTKSVWVFKVIGN